MMEGSLGHTLTIHFQLPCLLSEYKKKTDVYISELIACYDPGCLFSELEV